MKVINFLSSCLLMLIFVLFINIVSEKNNLETIANQYSILIAHKGMLTDNIKDELFAEHKVEIKEVNKVNPSIGEMVHVQFIKSLNNCELKELNYQIVVDRYIILGFMY